MKRRFSVLLCMLMLALILVACSGSDEAAAEKTEEELKAELREEMKEEIKEELKNELEAEAKSNAELSNDSSQEQSNEITKDEKGKEQEQSNESTEDEKSKNEVVKLSDDELIASKSKYESKLREYLSNLPGGFYTEDIREFEHYKNNSEFREYVDKLLTMGYGFEQAEGAYYLYVGEPTGYAEEGEEPKKQEENDASSGDTLIEKIGSNYYKYKTNTTVHFDLDGDGTDEEIRYEVQDIERGKLTVKGYEPIDITTEIGEQEYFVIVKFSDKFETTMNMIGIIDYGPSMDPVTQLYSIIAPRGENTLVGVGNVPGQLVHKTQYDSNKKEDFDYKAVLIENKGIEAPVRLSPNHVGTWFGRNLFTYYSTYCSLIDNINKYGQDYKTNVILNIKKPVKAYKEKDKETESVTIKGDQQVTLTATDNETWIKMKADDGTEGWVNVESVTNDNFSGFPMYD